MSEHPGIPLCRTNCRICRIPILTHSRNRGRNDIRCYFGCLEIDTARKSTKRSVRYNKTKEGKEAKAEYNAKRSKCSPNSVQSDKISEPTISNTPPQPLSPSAKETVSSVPTHRPVAHPPVNEWSNSVPSKTKMKLLTSFPKTAIKNQPTNSSATPTGAELLESTRDQSSSYFTDLLPQIEQSSQVKEKPPSIFPASMVPIARSLVGALALILTEIEGFPVSYQVVATCLRQQGFDIGTSSSQYHPP